jgi:hypothetical protein
MIYMRQDTNVSYHLLLLIQHHLLHKASSGRLMKPYLRREWINDEFFRLFLILAVASILKSGVRNLSKSIHSKIPEQILLELKQISVIKSSSQNSGLCFLEDDEED